MTYRSYLMWVQWYFIQRHSHKRLFGSIMKMYIWDSICLNQEGIVIEHIFLQYRSLKLYTHNLSRLNYLEAVKFRTSSKFNYWKAIYWHIIYQYENVCFQINNNFHYILYVQLLQHFRYMITNVKNRQM